MKTIFFALSVLFVSCGSPDAVESPKPTWKTHESQLAKLYEADYVGIDAVKAFQITACRAEGMVTILDKLGCEVFDITTATYEQTKGLINCTSASSTRYEIIKLKAECESQHGLNSID